MQIDIKQIKEQEDNGFLSNFWPYLLTRKNMWAIAVYMSPIKVQILICQSVKLPVRSMI